jgi:hypothetical protein
MLCCQGACFRDLPGVRVRPDNTVEWDPNVEREYLPSGKPLVKIFYYILPFHFYYYISRF